jgi:hypothetical protein
LIFAKCDRPWRYAALPLPALNVEEEQCDRSKLQMGEQPSTRQDNRLALDIVVIAGK